VYESRFNSPSMLENPTPADLIFLHIFGVTWTLLPSISLLHMQPRPQDLIPSTPYPRTQAPTAGASLGVFAASIEFSPYSRPPQGAASLECFCGSREQIKLPLGDHASAVEGSLEQNASNLLSFLLGLGSRTITSQGTLSYRTRTWKNTDAFGLSIFNSLGPTPTVPTYN